MKEDRKAYDSASIENLAFPDSVRKRPGMYMGEMGSPAVFQCIREVLDNCVDECLEGHASEIQVVVQGDKVSVIDNGRGIPKGSTMIENSADGTKARVPTLRAVFGVMHTSGKFNDQSYKVSRGSHGVGVKGTNALSSSLVVSSFHSGVWQQVEFSKGRVVRDVSTISKAPVHPVTRKPLQKGTIVTMVPDYTIIGKGAKLSMPELASWCQLSSYFTPSATLTIHMEKGDSWVTKTYSSPEGPSKYVADRVQTLMKNAEFGDVVDEVFVSSSPLYDCVMRFTSYDGCDARAFTNGLANVDGGTHLNATFAALKDALTPYATKKQNFTVNELKDGLIALVNMKISGPMFSSQTKEKLVDERGSELKAILQDAMDAWFKKNKKAALALVDRAARLKEMKTRFTASKQTLAALRKITKKGLPAVAATSPKCKASEREVMILEGQSASGGLRFARFEYFQEFLPMKGKNKNLVGMTPEKLAKETSEEILNILAMLGVDPKSPDPISSLRVSKIIVMSDSDSDGSHIQTLIFGVLYAFVPEVFDRGMVYTTRVPEYYSMVGQQVYSGDSLEEVQSLLKRDGVRGTVNHVKGYGEIDSALLRLFACDPATRSLYRVNAKSFDRFELLMGNDTGPRKQLLGL
jgi:DNA gyrase subunit B